MSGELYPTISHIYPVVRGLLANHLNEEENDINPIAKVKECLRDSINKRFNSGDELPLLLVAGTLNPTIRGRVLGQEQVETVKADILAKISVEVENEIETTSTKETTSEEPASKRTKVDQEAGKTIVVNEGGWGCSCGQG